MSNIKVIYGSCIDQEVDAIVNASNRNLWSGGGISGAIYRKAGYVELNEACKKIKTPLKDGDAVITPAFNIKNAKYIIHAVGPDFSYTPNAFQELYNAYYNSLVLLKENNLHSVAFPLISSWIFGYGLKNPVRESIKQCLKAYYSFIELNPNYDIEVKVCIFSEKEIIQLLYEEATMEEIDKFMNSSINITDEYLTDIAINEVYRKGVE